MTDGEHTRIPLIRAVEEKIVCAFALPIRHLSLGVSVSQSITVAIVPAHLGRSVMALSCHRRGSKVVLAEREKPDE